jgi:hypothetical protein
MLPGAPAARPSRPTGRTFLAAFGAVVSLGSLVMLVGLIQGSGDIELFVEPGWQVTVARIGLGVTGVAGTAVAWLVWRRLRTRWLLRRRDGAKAFALALLPGVIVSVFLAEPMYRVEAWASEHTAAAARDRQEFRAEIGDASHPPAPVDFGRPAADPGLGSHLLTPADLGDGWYDASRPNPQASDIPADRVAEGAMAGAKTHLLLARWQGHYWDLGDLLVESVTTFGSRAQATAFLKDLRYVGDPPPACVGTPRPYVAADPRRTSVWISADGCSRNTMRAVWRVDADVYVLLYSREPDHAGTPLSIEQIVTLAVTKAQLPKR